MRIYDIYGYLQVLYKKRGAFSPLSNENYLLLFISTFSLQCTRAFVYFLNICPCPCALGMHKMRGLRGHAGCSNILYICIYMYIYIYIYVFSFLRDAYINLYLFSCIVSQVLLIRHRSHFFAGTAFRGLRRSLAVTMRPSQRSALAFNINRGF